MVQVFVNLVENAVAYGPKDKHVDIVLEEEGTDVVLRVHNHGTPIPAADLPAIFEAFRRGANQNNRRGLGLGLFIVRQIVVAHRGTVEAGSSGDGTTFVVRVPKA